MEDEFKKSRMKRIEANDPAAMCQMAGMQYKKGDHDGAFEYFSKATGLGDIKAHFQLSVMYENGQGVKMDEKKEVYHCEQAAIGGHPEARCDLGFVEVESGRIDRAVKHFIIAAKLGHDGSIEALKDLYADGYVSKEDFASALRAHQAAIDATKSPQREAAAELGGGRRTIGGC
jgi:TPR repeat protein